MSNTPAIKLSNLKAAQSISGYNTPKATRVTIDKTLPAVKRDKARPLCSRGMLSIIYAVEPPLVIAADALIINAIKMRNGSVNIPIIK